MSIIDHCDISNGDNTLYLIEGTTKHIRKTVQDLSSKTIDVHLIFPPFTEFDTYMKPITTHTTTLHCYAAERCVRPDVCKGCKDARWALDGGWSVFRSCIVKVKDTDGYAVVHS
jgi:hypothetical protein